MKLVLHRLTDKQVRAVMKGQPHAVLIIGPTGSGKTFLANHIAENALATTNLEVYPYFRTIDAATDGGIGTIRTIREFVSLKTVGNSTIRRILVINDAHNLGTEAQNALLKTLEEPPIDTMIILTAPDTTGLLPTILSRVQIVQVHPVSYEIAVKAFSEASTPDDKFRRDYYLSGGHVGLLKALITESENHELSAAVLAAKQLLKQTPYERLARVDELGKQKPQVLLLLDGLEMVLGAVLHDTSKNPKPTVVRRLHHLRKITNQANRALERNANPKLTLTNLFWQL